AVATRVMAPPAPHASAPSGVRAARLRAARLRAARPTVPSAPSQPPCRVTRVALAERPGAGAAVRMRGMGIRMLHRTAGPPPRAGADGPGPEAHPSVPAFATAARTARLPDSLATALRHATTGPGRRIAGTVRPATAALPDGPLPWRQWAEAARGCLTLVLTLLPRPRPVRTITVFVAAGDPVSVRRYGSGPQHRGFQGPGWPEPGGATP